MMAAVFKKFLEFGRNRARIPPGYERVLQLTVSGGCALLAFVDACQRVSQKAPAGAAFGGPTLLGLVLSPLIAAMLAASLCLLAYQHGSQPALHIAAVAAPLILVGYLVRPPARGDYLDWSLVIFPVGLIAFFGSILAGRSRHIIRRFIPALFVGIAVIAMIAMIILFTGFTSEGSWANPYVAYFRPAEILVVCIVGLVVGNSVLLNGQNKPDYLTNVWVIVAPFPFFLVTRDLGSSIVIAMGIAAFVLSGLKAGSRWGAIVSVAAVAAFGFFSVAVRGVGNWEEWQNPAANSATAWAVKMFNEGNLVGTGRVSDDDLPGQLRHELALTLVGKQWGFFGTVLVLALFALLAAVLVWHLWAVGATFAGRVAIVVGVMLISNIMLALLVTGGWVPRLEVSLPLLSGDTTSYIITLGILGFIAGVSGRTPNGTRSGGSAEEATHAN